MSLKSLIQIIIFLLIISIIAAIYYKYFDTNKNIIEEINSLEDNNQEQLRELEKKIADLELKNNEFIDKVSGKKINDETIRLLEIQKHSMIKFLIKIPKLYYTKSHFPLEISQRAFDHLWRVCESYEMWCKETKQEELITLEILN